MFGKKEPSAQVEQAVAKAVNYEVTMTDMARRSQRRAWIVAWCAVLMSLILAGGYFVFLPLKEKVPYLVMADPYTGTATVARLQGNFDDNSITMREAINKSSVAQFVLARESYDSGLIGDRNWRTVLSMAGPQVAPEYMAVHSDQNPDRPTKIYGATQAVHVRILSIILVGGQGRPYTGATVRFQRSLYDKTRGSSTPIDSKIATLEFRFNPALKLSEEARVLNPLGFRVTGYRVDNDYAGAPPPEPAFPSPAAIQQQRQQQAAPAAPGMPGPAVDGATVPGAQAPAVMPEGVPQGDPDAAIPAAPAAATAPTTDSSAAAAASANGVNTQ